MKQFDLIVIGAGIVGAATALRLQTLYPAKTVLVLEKEAKPAQHQTGRNSGVVHAGVYYPPDSLKAQFCREGLSQTIEFCKKNKLAYEQCGKLLVATNANELQRMDALYQRCQDNEIEPALLSQSALQKREPLVSGLGGIFVKQTGITDYQAITAAMLEKFSDLGGTVAYQQEVTGLSEDEKAISVKSSTDLNRCEFLVNCCGVMADRVTKMLGLKTDFQILPFRGEYYRLSDKYNGAFKHLIYPIPDPNLPFLGVHITKMIDGSVTVGPNAVLALGREAYDKLAVNWRDVYEMLAFKGSYPLFAQHFRSGCQELANSSIKKLYLKQVQKYCPSIKLDELLPYPSGIRAQAVSEQGELIHDFKFVESPHSLNVANAPSPAATSALPIANYIVDKIKDKLV